MPPLRDRRDDILRLANWFLRRHGDKAKRHVSGFSADALACLLAYEWPGNVRELENAVEYAVVLGDDSQIVRDDLPDAIVEAAALAADTGDTRSRSFHQSIRQTRRTSLCERSRRQTGTIARRRACSGCTRTTCIGSSGIFS